MNIQFKLLTCLTILFSCHFSHAESWNKTPSKTDDNNEYNIYSLLSENKDKNNNSQLAIVMTSFKDNSFNKIGFVSTVGKLPCEKICQYYIKFNNTAGKYSFTEENNAIKLNDSQKEDFLKNILNSKEITILLPSQKYFFNVSNPNWKLIDDTKK